MNISLTSAVTPAGAKGKFLILPIINLIKNTTKKISTKRINLTGEYLFTFSMDNFCSCFNQNNDLKYLTKQIDSLKVHFSQ